MADRELTPFTYAVYGVLCAAKLETGPGGARRIGRIMERLETFDTAQIELALLELLEQGWIRQLDPIMGMYYFEATHGPDGQPDPAKVHGCPVCGERLCRWSPDAARSAPQ